MMSEPDLSCTRRNVLVAAAVASAAVLGPVPMHAAAGDVRPFKAYFPDEALADLRRRVAATKWPTQELVEDTSQGVQLGTMRKLAHHWLANHDWGSRRAFWSDRTAHEETLRQNLFSLEATRRRHVGSDPNLELYDPDLWTDEFAFLNQLGQADIQTELFYDYRSNVAAYPKWQGWMRDVQPRLLVIWGKYDLSFDISEPAAYRHDVPGAEVYILEAGHFALDTAADQVADLVGGFLQRPSRHE